LGTSTASGFGRQSPKRSRVGGNRTALVGYDDLITGTENLVAQRERQVRAAE